MSEKKNALLERTFELAIEAVNVYKFLKSRNEYILSKQFLKSATCPGATAREA